MIETLSEPCVRTIEINMPNRLGFHLLVVVQFVKCVREFSCNICIRKGNVLADGKSILEILILEAAWKSKLQIEAVGDDAVQAVESIKEFFLNQESISSFRLKKDFLLTS